jgi:hypothetical protein
VLVAWLTRNLVNKLVQGQRVPATPHERFQGVMKESDAAKTPEQRFLCLERRQKDFLSPARSKTRKSKPLLSPSKNSTLQRPAKFSDEFGW